MWLNTVAQFDNHYVLTLINLHANATLSFPLDLRLNDNIFDETTAF